MKYAWVMKVVPPWTGLVIGWLLAIFCHYYLVQGPLVFVALPTLGLLVGLRVSRKLNHHE